MCFLLKGKPDTQGVRGPHVWSEAVMKIGEEERRWNRLHCRGLWWFRACWAGRGGTEKEAWRQALLQHGWHVCNKRDWHGVAGGTVGAATPLADRQDTAHRTGVTRLRGFPVPGRWRFFSFIRVSLSYLDASDTVHERI